MCIFLKNHVRQNLQKDLSAISSAISCIFSIEVKQSSVSWSSVQRHMKLTHMP